MITCLNDYRPIALTPVIAKCFERLVITHIKDYIPVDLDQYQFAYRANRSTEDAICVAMHAALSHLEKPNTYSTSGCSLLITAWHLTPLYQAS